MTVKLYIVYLLTVLCVAINGYMAKESLTECKNMRTRTPVSCHDIKLTPFFCFHFMVFFPDTPAKRLYNTVIYRYKIAIATADTEAGVKDFLHNNNASHLVDFIMCSCSTYVVLFNHYLHVYYYFLRSSMYTCVLCIYYISWKERFSPFNKLLEHQGNASQTKSCIS